MTDAWDAAIIATFRLKPYVDLDRHEAIIRAFLSALPIPDAEATLRAMVEGTWKAVPVEPTEAMLAAAFDVRGYETEDIDSEITWQHMLAAAPASPNGGPAG